jgi:hypothetical protein
VEALPDWLKLPVKVRRRFLEHAQQEGQRTKTLPLEHEQKLDKIHRFCASVMLSRTIPDGMGTHKRCGSALILSFTILDNSNIATSPTVFCIIGFFTAEDPAHNPVFQCLVQTIRLVFIDERRGS